MFRSNHQMFKLSRFPAMLLGTKEIVGFLAKDCAMWIVASSFLISIWVAPCFRTDSLINLAASASASDLIICAFLSSSSLNTMNLCISANCCCTAFLSIALEYSLLKPKCIKLTSETDMLNSWALCRRFSLIYLLIVYLDLRSWSASSKIYPQIHWATIVLRIYWPIELNTFFS